RPKHVGLTPRRSPAHAPTLADCVINSGVRPVSLSREEPMAEAPLTRPSLLLRLRDAGDQQAWEEFVDLYAPLVYGFARKHGLQDADAADLTQEVLRAVAGAVPRLDYDPARGSFIAWLLTVVRNKLLNFLAAARRREQGRGDTDGQLLLER